MTGARFCAAPGHGGPCNAPASHVAFVEDTSAARPVGVGFDLCGEHAADTVANFPGHAVAALPVELLRPGSWPLREGPGWNDYEEAEPEGQARREDAEACEVCGRSGPAAKRCAFGHRSGVCSCWRGVPCGAPVPAKVGAPNAGKEVPPAR